MRLWESWTKANDSIPTQGVTLNFSIFLRYFEINAVSNLIRWWETTRRSQQRERERVKEKERRRGPEPYFSFSSVVNGFLRTLSFLFLLRHEQPGGRSASQEDRCLPETGPFHRLQEGGAGRKWKLQCQSLISYPVSLSLLFFFLNVPFESLVNVVVSGGETNGRLMLSFGFNSCDWWVGECFWDLMVCLRDCSVSGSVVCKLFSQDFFISWVGFDYFGCFSLINFLLGSKCGCL